MTLNSLKKVEDRIKDLPHVYNVYASRQGNCLHISITLDSWLYKLLFRNYLVEFIRTEVLNKYAPVGAEIEIEIA